MHGLLFGSWGENGPFPSRGFNWDLPLPGTVHAGSGRGTTWKLGTLLVFDIYSHSVRAIESRSRIFSGLRKPTEGLGFSIPGNMEI